VVAIRKILVVAFALLCAVGLVWFVVTFRWTCLIGLTVMFTLSWFAPPPPPKDRKQFTRILTVEDAEAENMEVCAGSGTAPVPFGSINRQWRELLEKRRNRDVLWAFYSAEEWVDGHVGRAGVALVRDGKVVGLVLSAPRLSKATSSGCRGYLGRRRYFSAKRPTDAPRLPSQHDGTRQPCGLSAR